MLLRRRFGEFVLKRKPFSVMNTGGSSMIVIVHRPGGTDPARAAISGSVGVRRNMNFFSFMGQNSSG